MLAVDAVAASKIHWRTKVKTRPRSVHFNEKKNDHTKKKQEQDTVYMKSNIRKFERDNATLVLELEWIDQSSISMRMAN